MRFLFDIGHPAHVHYFRIVANKLQKEGHSVLFTLRNKDIAEDLLIKYNFEYVKLGKSRKGLINKILWVIKFTVRIIKVIRKFKPDLLISFYSPYLAYASTICRIPSLGFADTEHAIFNIKTTYPFTSLSLTPSCFRINLGEKHLRFDSYMELSYLHKNKFTPDKSILSRLNITNNENYVLLRLVSWDAHHDIGKSGISDVFKRQLIEMLQEKFTIFISSEKELPEDLEQFRLKTNPTEIHNVLSFASAFISESGTMASESAILGTPVLYMNELPLMGYLEEAQKNGLLFHITKEKDILEFIENKLLANFSKDVFIEAKNKHISNKIDLSEFMYWFFVNYPSSFDILRENPNYQYNFK